MKKQKHILEGSVVLYGVPKVCYGAFGGCTPYPIALKAAANYMGIDIDYADAHVACGAAFRLTWDTTAWNGGNVDVTYTFDDPARVYRSGVEALGRSFSTLGREASTAKEDFIAFLLERIGRGVPVIALGVIGPQEACVITGYRDGGNTLLGWNCFQDSPEFSSGVSIDDSGYFVTSAWWDNPGTIALIGIGEEACGAHSVKEIVAQGVEVLEGRQVGKFAKGIAAYAAWKAALLDESQFSENLIVPLRVERLMCQGDGMDCLADGRSSAAKYFAKLAAKHPGQPLYSAIQERFAACAAAAHQMYRALGGWERDEAQMDALMRRDTREKLAGLLGECQAADEKALALMKELLAE